jgi:transcriptional regulator with XRE-family HTH domain
VANVRSLSDAGPIAAPALKRGPDFEVEVCAHAATIAKLCARGKQHFAQPREQSLRMAAKSINQTVAHALGYYMRKAGLKEKQLGKKAGVSPRTVGNFLRPESRVSGSRGKEPSGKLTELALLADALDVEVAQLVIDMSDDQRERQRRIKLAARILSGEDAEAAAH